jgi:hypothetical protein
MYRIIGADGREYGPVSAEQLRQWMTEGRVNHQTRVRPEDSPDWKTVADLPEFSAPPPINPPVQTPPSVRVPNYLVPAILVTLLTLCCCVLPFGVPAIVYAGQVNGKLSAGDVAGAQEASRKALMWCWIAFGLGFIGNVLGGFLWGLRFGALRHHPWI